MEVALEEKISTTSVILGYIYGKFSPDKQIMVGTSMDSLGPGASTSGNGYAVLMELLDVLTKTMETTGWKPRRTIVFALFGGSKFGNIGSTEWVLQNKRTISSRLIAYINLDEIISSFTAGPYEQEESAFAGFGSPLFKKVIAAVTDEIR